MTRLLAILEAELRRTGITTRATLQAALRTSQPTLARALARMGPDVVRLGAGRATHYALTRTIGHHGSAWPLYRVDRDGQVRECGMLTALHGDHTAFQPSAEAKWLVHRTRPHGAFPSLPWFLADLRPQGFLGRHFAQRVAADLGAPTDPQRWSSSHVIAALLAHGADAPGDFVLGRAMLDRVQRARLQPPAAVELAQRGTRYSELASAAVAGEAAGSSAGGEFPKFATVLDLGGGQRRHVIVKFSEAANTPAKRRWVDLLICEHHASSVLAERGIAAAPTELVVAGERLCLEVTRHDRVGAHGRRGLVTLAALDDAWYGLRDQWPMAAARLQRDGWIDAATAGKIDLLHLYGQLIANADMHFGNLAFLLEDDRPLALAPSYDMLPMHYRPTNTGEIVERAFVPPLPAPRERETWQRAAGMAVATWRAVAEDARVSLPFRRIAADNAAAIERAASQT